MGEQKWTHVQSDLSPFSNWCSFEGKTVTVSWLSQPKTGCTPPSLRYKFLDCVLKMEKRPPSSQVF